MTDLWPTTDDRLAPSDRLADVTDLLLTSTAAAAGPEVRQEMLRFAADHADALLRSCPAGHFTGSALVVDATGEHTLLLFHTKLQRWLQPGGHADGDANLVAVALREATEETGIIGLSIDPDPLDLDIHAIRPPGEAPHLHLDVRFLVVAPADAVVQGNHESEALRWVPIGELAGLGLDAGTERLGRAGAERRRLSASS